ncbi:M56 family metallopeptidase [Pedobacter sp.]|uniref:M56 family metallopeptidase n=1 Tax=Pedobacter sp. TaxID=1411316 RepID=UPI0031D034C3
MKLKWVNFLPPDLMEALFGTLLNSLWIGLVTALFAALFIVGTKNSRPVLRYNLLVALLSVFSLSMILVFVQTLNKVNIITSLFGFNQSQQNAIFKFQLDIFAAFDQFFEILKHYAGPMILIWLLIILFKSIQLLVGLHGVSYLKRTKNYTAGNYWEQKVATLARQLNINQSIAIFQSGLAKIPMVIGHFKPVILMPIGLLNHLSLNEVEAILSHELAHIKRRDYLVNILQNIIEVLFFFNPAVLWLSKIIREERENCCDDLAIACTNDKNGYLKALVSCQEFSLNSTGFAMSMANEKGQLIARIRRIAFNNRTTLSGFEKATLSISLCFFVALGAAFKMGQSSIQHSSLQKEMSYINGLNHQFREAKPINQPVRHENCDPVGPSAINLGEAEADDVPELAAIVEVEPIADLPQDKPEEPVIPVKPVAPVRNTISVNQPISNVISVPVGVTTTTTTTTSTVKVDGKVVVHIVHDGNDASQEIQDQMIQDNLVVKGKKVNYTLTDNEMLVNGIAQDASIHQKYRDKYIKRPDIEYRISR